MTKNNNKLLLLILVGVIIILSLMRYSRNNPAVSSDSNSISLNVYDQNRNPIDDSQLFATINTIQNVSFISATFSIKNGGNIDFNETYVLIQGDIPIREDMYAKYLNIPFGSPRCFGKGEYPQFYYTADIPSGNGVYLDNNLVIYELSGRNYTGTLCGLAPLKKKQAFNFTTNLIDADTLTLGNNTLALVVYGVYYDYNDNQKTTKNFIKQLNYTVKKDPINAIIDIDVGLN